MEKAVATSGRSSDRWADAAASARRLLYFDVPRPYANRALRPPAPARGLLSGATGAIQLSEGVSDGAALLANARSLRLEGIVAKHRDRPHRSGRTGDWLKIKCVQSESFMIVGYEQSTSARSGIGSLLLAGRKGHDCV